MKKAIIARKIGMTQIFTEDGTVVPVTVLQAGPCPVVQVKTVENDGYSAVQLGFEEKTKNVTKPAKGHFEKANVPAQKFLKEFRLADAENYQIGQMVTVESFAAGDYVDVTGRSKGKGYQGAIKRHGQHRGPMAHGSKYHRYAGSMGNASFPGRVFKGKKLPGHMGAVQITVQNLEVVRVDAENNLLLIKGAVPGAKKTVVTVRNAVKKA